MSSIFTKWTKSKFSSNHCRDLKERIIVEFPDEFPDIKFREMIQANYERTVVTSDFFGEKLPVGKILTQHNCWFRIVETKVVSLLSLARVAGYREAIFGLPKIYYPLLFLHPKYPNIMISTISLSNFRKGRFAPKIDWQTVMERLSAWLDYKDDITPVIWDMSVKPSFSTSDILPENHEQITFKQNVRWFENNIIFENEDHIGVFEGYVSGISENGRQSLRPKTRGDCSGEAAMIPALNWAIDTNHNSRKLSTGIMDTLFNGPELADNDLKSPTYGSLRFYEYNPVYYSDDNARAIMGCILASELIDNTDFCKNILRCLFSLLRTTGKQGFRQAHLKTPDRFLSGNSWQTYQNEDFIECRPHYHAYLWAAFLQGYLLTGDQEFYDKAISAISITMDKFPDLLWTNGITQEYARMLLPLAFLIQINDNHKYKNWLKTIANSLLEQMVSCGAIRELMGPTESGKYPAPQSNNDYGTNEAPLIQENGDPCCDLVYTMNYAFIGLHEAFIATNDDFYRNASNKIADFLCRIQIKSEEQPYLDGAWMRGFDYELWEYYGSSADNGWGAWCVESGWTNSWITTTLGLRTMGRGLLCQKYSDKYKSELSTIRKEMKTIYKVNK